MQSRSGSYDAGMDWQPVTVFPTSELRWEVEETSVPDGDEWASIYKIAFRGAYRSGSQGRPDAGLMAAVTAAALAVSYPDAVLLDFTELDYEWGNNLLDLLPLISGRDREFPVGWVIAAGPNAFSAVATLIGQDTGRVFPELGIALNRAVELAVERSRLIG